MFELILTYMILLTKKDLKKRLGISKFTRIKNWISSLGVKIPEEKTLELILSKTLKISTFLWNILEISEDISEINFIDLNEKSNSWMSLIRKLISLLRTSDLRVIIVFKQTLKITILDSDRILKNSFNNKSTIFKSYNILNFTSNLREKYSIYKSLIISFPTWTNTNNSFYFNLIKIKTIT